MTVQVLAKPVAALLNVHAESLELAALVAAADAEVEPAVAEDVQHRCLLGGDYGVVERQHDDGCADSHALGAGGDVSGEGVDAGQKAMAGEVVLAEPDLVEAKPFSEFDLLDRLVERLALRPVGVGLDYVEHTELHGMLPLFTRGWPSFPTV